MISENRCEIGCNLVLINLIHYRESHTAFDWYTNIRDLEPAATILADAAVTPPSPK